MRYREVEVILRANDWELNRVNGSHHIWTKPNQDIIDVVVHNREVKVEYLKIIAVRLALRTG
jgi:predicted RNA binding protein YcfA (HicA-like mRNA interferase family)